MFGLGTLVLGMKRLNWKLTQAHGRSNKELMESESKYRRIFDDSVIAIYVLDTRKKFIDANQAGLELLGYSKEELFQLSLPDVSVDPGETDDICAMLLDSRQIINREHQLEKKNKETITVIDNAISITDLSDNVIGIQSTVIDITQRKLAEQKIISDQVFVNSLLEAIPIPIYFKDIKGRYLGVNKAFEMLYDSDRDQFIGKTVFETHPRNLAQMFHEKDQELMASGGNQEYEAQLMTGGDALRDVVIHKAVFPDDLGGTAGIIGTVRDITEHRRNDRIQAVRALLSEFSLTNSVQDLLRRFLDEAELMTESRIGFFHFLEPDQKTLSLQMWSSNTLERMCDIDLTDTANTHYPVCKAGVWVDCIKQGGPVIHNDYESLENRKGLPQGHAPVSRELVIPVFRADKIVAILGVGNKTTRYTEEDVQTVSEIADIAWDIVSRKQTEESLQASQ